MYLDVDVTVKSNIVRGLTVDVVSDKNKATQELTRGCVQKIISNKDCKRGIKVELTNGVVGHIKGIPSKNDIEKDRFKFYNLFFYSKEVYGIWDKKNKKFLVLNRLNKLTNKLEKTILLFSSEKIAETKTKGTSLDTSNLIIKKVFKKNKSFESFFKEYEIDVYVIDLDRKLRKAQMKELEEKFKSF